MREHSRALIITTSTTTTTTTMELPILTIEPTAPHTHTVVFLHGRGDDARHFSRTIALTPDSHGRALPAALPSFRWVFPQAPTRTCASSPGDSWPQWFDVWDVRDFAHTKHVPGAGPDEGVLKGVDTVLRLLDGRIEQVKAVAAAQEKSKAKA
ncbi:hypothetical protein NUW54_g7978 [Trametes sanguinea]|uniref:Uncharacterized protein n=1 Tax=Trametes sanguinea TaxID=158606 RepID=A0ACC1PJV2_9APHY|nr:hypothetical protein NUW54_g7978 [Trametes sanguinea]